MHLPGQISYGEVHRLDRDQTKKIASEICSFCRIVKQNIAGKIVVSKFSEKQPPYGSSGFLVADSCIVNKKDVI